jgi:hypothetical protein
MRPAVLLRHDLPDGSGHWDWLIQRPGPPDAPLMSFRTPVRIDTGESPTFAATRIGDHRAVYLTFEGPISGGRGAVWRVASGQLAILEETPESLILQGQIGAAAGTFRARPIPGAPDEWRFELTPAP